MNPSIQFKKTTSLAVLMSFMLACFGLSPRAQAVCQEGCGVNENTFLGEDALISNAFGSFNTAIGNAALDNCSNCNDNTAVGSFALLENTGGGGNTAVGDGALSLNTGSDNIALGVDAGDNLTTGSNNIDIGNRGSAGESNTIRIGISGTQTKTVIAGIFGTTVVGGVGVIVGSGGRLGTLVSSVRFKEEVKPMGKAS